MGEYANMRICEYAKRPQARLLVSALAFVSACAHAPTPPEPATRPATAPATAPAPAIIPMPASLQQMPDSFILTTRAAIIVSDDTETLRLGHYLAALIGTTTESTPRVLTSRDTSSSVIELAIHDSNPMLGAEGYSLTVTPERVRITARDPVGIFYGIQTLRQLLPYAVEYTAALPKNMAIPAVQIVDAPRYEWRGAMLDVARHFLAPSDVMKYIDIMALYKLNRLHLHLADDQGWRIEIPAWPNLTTVGASSAVGGRPGGYYTQADYAAIVQYARDRFITIVPEIDMPGHTNAALASYPELNCDGVAPPLYTGISVGFSVLCVDKDVTFRFIDDVVGAITGITPGPYFHVGGDEVKKLGRDRYNQFVERVQKIVEAHGKRMIGWSEVALANLPGSVIVQSWIPDSASVAAARGSKVILSPASRLYLDMKYDSAMVLGLNWAGYVNLEKAYSWEPAQFNPLLPPEAILGLEAPLWAETLGVLADYEYMALPRMTALAELAWSPLRPRDWPRFHARVRAHEARWTALGLNYRRLDEY